VAEGVFYGDVHLVKGGRGEGERGKYLRLCFVCIFINAGFLVGNSMCERYEVVLQCEGCWGLELYPEIVR
jgi:hypothetical protein